jgi:hypothetical protein
MHVRTSRLRIITRRTPVTFSTFLTAAVLTMAFVTVPRARAAETIAEAANARCAIVTDTRKLIDEINLSPSQTEQSLKDVAAAREAKGS